MSGDASTVFLSAYDAVLARWPVRVEPIDLPSMYGTTRVNACGPVDGPPLVLLHGGGTTAAMWFANVAEFAHRHRVYAVDRIGEPGRSVRGGRPPRDVHDLLGWLDGVLDGLGVENAAVCGHSYGAWIALTYGLHAPRRVRRLVLLDPTQCFGGFRAGYLARALPSLIRPTASRARAFLAWETGGAHADPAWSRLYGLAAEFPDTKVITGRRPRPESLRALTTPTLVLLAGRGKAHSPHRVASAATHLLPHAEVTVLPGQSHHSMPWHDAASLNAHVIDFLNRTAS
ncbi:alpha/beta fold hydrolase [Streptosporangium saharense]|uniref:Pimeloyl-ACP methyl ester carboxylesterase n=1 Tax=Streptosporangium saharense TaxID=1706840 RepID=A0A7W7QGJ6_9ACTN|nr:alpha/beta hydrolase [Streptosporangium saharense]MBB4913217.1 pimeloyl-ACP methyl ester carboxylesterase [Streptosporangium saharense]